MLTLSFTFPAGRYHGTPWGRHVNEADVAWPPDPWRLTRALIATWHRKLNPERHPRGSLIGLLASLASEAPHYQLPEAVHFHTRHYMPVKAKPSLIFDAFAQIGREAALIVHWPSLCLPADQEALLDEALSVMGYLGRAESWVDARRLENWCGICNCIPDDDSPMDLADLVPLWHPLTPADYRHMRELQLEAAQARAEAERLTKEADAILAGKSPAKATKTKAAKLPADLLATLPEDWLEAIALDTGELQKAGWSAPPAARRLTYRRPKDALRFMASTVSRRRSSAPADPTTARFALYAKPLPLLTDAVRIGETLRRAAMGRARRICAEQVPPLLAGHDLPEGNRHMHAFFIPEDADGDGRVDHMILHAPGGLDERMREVLARLNRVYAKDEQEWQLLLEGLGTPNQFPQSALLGHARVWESCTPYLHPWFRKKHFGVSQQVERECHLRGLPALESIDVLPDLRSPRVLDFRRFRSKAGLTQPDRHGCRLRLTFSEPLSGPLALGFACHFGLGLFSPVERA